VVVSVGSPSNRARQSRQRSIDTLTNVGKLQFSDQTTDLSWFTKAASLSAGQLASLVESTSPPSIERRTPWARHWGSQLKDGMSLQDIAKSFFVQPEAAAFYAATQSTQSFVSSVYDNVLNRDLMPRLAYWLKGCRRRCIEGCFLLRSSMGEGISQRHRRCKPSPTRSGGAHFR